jgi:hypothetical protein
MTKLPRERILGAAVAGVGHSRYSEPTSIIEGIGPARFRSHYITLDSGLVLELSVAGVTVSNPACVEMQGESEGIAPQELIGRRVTALFRDDLFAPIIVLDDTVFLKDDNDGCYGNPLHAGYLKEEYSAEQVSQFVNYEDGCPVDSSDL